MRFRFAPAVFLVASILTPACSTPPVTTDALDVPADTVTNTDAPADRADTGPAMCATDNDCSDSVFCNGSERCMPGATGANAFGCVAAAAPACTAPATCDEAADRCNAACTTDADGDGHRTPACGGDDCDDNDPQRFPGNAEVCDAMSHDEDCDPCTVAAATGFDGDSDHDAYAGQGCANRYSGPTPTCDPMHTRVVGSRLEVTGADCDDTNSSIRPDQAEACNGIDDDCDGMIDDGVTLHTYYPDNDGDSFGNGMAAARMGCTPPTGYVEDGTDCDDTNGASHPGAMEICDTIDNDCDGMIDEAGMAIFYRDTDGDTYGDGSAPMSAMQCTAPSGFAARANDCNDADPEIHPGAAERCNRIDDSCSLPVGMTGGALASEDVDNDGYSSPSAACTGGFPQTDCRDDDASIHPGAIDTCNGVDDNCDGTIDDAATAAMATCSPGLACVAGRCGAIGGIALGINFTCARYTTGTVACWGADGSGQLGLLDVGAGQRVPVHRLTTAIDIAAGGTDACARTREGTVVCWGSNVSGQLGDGTTIARATPLPVSGIADAIDVAMGTDHSCALLSTGAVRCWGSNQFGGLGDGTTTLRTTPVAVTGLTDAIAVSAGIGFTCAIRTGGSVSCWGLGGRLGNGSSANSNVPVAVTGISDAVEIDSASSTTCVRRRSGAVSCWGFNTRGEAGDGSTASRTVPVSVLGLTDAVALAAGSVHFCAMRASGAISCWGANDVDQLGNGTMTDSPSPVNASASTAGVLALDAGGDHTCIALATGGIACWGANSAHQLDASTMGPASSSAPIPVFGLSDTVQLATGSAHACARKPDGSLYCWGRNADGQLGDGTTTNRPTFTRVANSIVFAEITAAGGHTCGRTPEGSVYCWGRNADGELGDGTTTTRTMPTPVTGITDAVEIVAGGSHTCARLASGAVQCWGANTYGQLGDGTTTASNVPVTVSGVSGVVQLVAGSNHTCALGGGRVICWGRNTSGQIGDGTNTDRPTPVTLSGAAISGATEIAAGGDHTCGRMQVMTTVVVLCWGRNNSGQLGDGTTTNRNTPVRVGTALADSNLMAAGMEHTLMRENSTGGSQRFFSWGSDAFGQLANSTTYGSHTAPDATQLVLPNGGYPYLVSAGDYFTCFGAGSVSCAGSNSDGQIGTTSTGSRFEAPVWVMGL